MRGRGRRGRGQKGYATALDVRVRCVCGLSGRDCGGLCKDGSSYNHGSSATHPRNSASRIEENKCHCHRQERKGLCPLTRGTGRRVRAYPPRVENDIYWHRGRARGDSCSVVMFELRGRTLCGAVKSTRSRAAQPRGSRVAD